MVPRAIRPYGDELLFLEVNMEELILFILTFFFVFIIYELFIVRRAKNNGNKKKKKTREPIEVTYLVRRYRLDLEKVDYNQLLQIIALISSFDIALIVSIIMILKNFVLEILVGFISTLIIILVSYHFVYLFYKKKGMIKNES